MDESIVNQEMDRTAARGDHGDPTGAGSPNIRDTKQNKRQTKMQGSAFVSHPLHTINGTHNSKLGIWPETALRYYAR